MGTETYYQTFTFDVCPYEDGIEQFFLTVRVKDDGRSMVDMSDEAEEKAYDLAAGRLPQGVEFDLVSL